MKPSKLPQILIFLMMLITFSSCDLVLGILEAGMWVGIVIVLIIIFLIGWLIKKFF